MACAAPAVLIVDEPTRGIDVGTKAEVHRLLSDLAGQGVAVLMISSELPEVLGMADRVIVLFEGRVSGEFSRAEASEEAIMRAATGARGRGGRVSATAETANVGPVDGRSRSHALAEAIFRFRELGIVLALVIVVTVTAVHNSNFVSDDEPAAAAVGRRDHRHPRDRRDDRDHHAERRPVDRVDPRDLRLRGRRHLRESSRTSGSLGLPDRDGDRARRAGS